MTDQEITLLAECAWKENRHGLTEGMTSIINVVLNRVKRTGKSITEVIMAPWQFTSMSVKSDPEYKLDPEKSTGLDMDMWNRAIDLAQDASDGKLADLTFGSTLYYAPGSIKTTRTYTLPDGKVIPFPEKWDANKVRYTVTVAGQPFFIEV